MEKINCLRCNFRHTDNGNCTAVGGFCTAVTAAHCPLLREYLDTGLEPEAVETVKLALAAKHLVDLETLNNTPISRLVELAEADKDGRVVVLPCKVGDTVYILRRAFDGADVVGETELWWDDIPQLGKTVFLTREEAENALQEMEGKSGPENVQERYLCPSARAETMQTGG